MMSEFKHLPVMLHQVIEYLEPKSGGIYLDGTMGLGGHSRAILEASEPQGRLIALDRDEDAISAGKATLEPYMARVTIIRERFSQIAEVAKEFAPEGLDGILMDIGVSSFQLDEAERGFSYMQDAPLDMRMDRRQKKSAYEVINKYDKDELTRIFYQYGEENWSKRIAEFICAARKEKVIETTGELVRIIKNAVPRNARDKDQHPAKRVFQALRIEVNNELGELEQAIMGAAASLKKGGRLAVITFHSLEDRIVKEKFNYLAADCICPPNIPVCICDKMQEVRIITKKPLTAETEEIESNPRARSAKMRVCERV